VKLMLGSRSPPPTKFCFKQINFRRGDVRDPNVSKPPGPLGGFRAHRIRRAQIPPVHAGGFLVEPFPRSANTSLLGDFCIRTIRGEGDAPYEKAISKSRRA
jgi:hypothetical protein